jgi:hypothetical protein
MRVAPLLLVALAGCASIPLPHRHGERAPSLARKQVADKREPHDLVAIDGSRCTTTEKRFERAQRGDRVWCLWRDARGDASTGE